MRRMIVVSLTGVGLMAAGLGCAWVKLDAEAESVRVVATQAEVEACTKVGTINAQTRAKLGFISRNEGKVSNELASLARNNAVGMMANTLLAEAPPDDEGKQRFAAYRCDRDERTRG